MKLIRSIVNKIRNLWLRYEFIVDRHFALYAPLPFVIYKDIKKNTITKTFMTKIIFYSKLNINTVRLKKISNNLYNETH